ncbi:hypothetical protein [uncultured Veillonella sp.]|jgi:hypothetical protein|uniref:DUF1659 domain-containing protein n=1 Tax=uncultured Veillonella sp. TaxID=159268 RepID=UPI00258C39C0|nr:hypothetical protein [uncultured Veillonella sp.]
MSEEMVHAMNEEANDMKDTGVVASKEDSSTDDGVRANEADSAVTAEETRAGAADKVGTEIDNVSVEKSDGESPDGGDDESHDGIDGESPDVVDDGSHDGDDGADDTSDDYDEEEEEERGPSWDVMVPTTKVQLRLNVESEGSSKVKLVAFNNISPKKTDEELNILCDKLASLFAYPSVGFVRINTMTYKPESLLFK